ncbi:MAG: glycosyltransferase family 4 protein [Gemmatimonadota bacterium]
MSEQGLPAGSPGPRVLYLNDLLGTDKFGSLEEEIFEITRAVRARRGTMIPVFRGVPDQPLRARYDAAGLQVEGIDLRHLKLSSAFRLVALVYRQRIQFVHWHFYSAGNAHVWVLSILAPWLRHFRTDHMSRAFPLYPTLTGLRRFLKRALFRRYEKVLCISDFVMSCARREDLWQSLARVTYFINVERFAPAPDVRREIRSRSLAEGTFVLLFVGHLTKYKGCDLAIRALANLPETEVLWIVGDGPERGHLEALAGELGVAERTQFLGQLQDVAPYMQAADCLVVPSIWGEGAGFVNLEAQACGLPVVASCIGGIPEFVEDGETGLLFTAGDHAGLTGCIRRLHDDPELLARLGRQARRRAVEQFSTERRIGEHVDIYSDRAGIGDER